MSDVRRLTPERLEEIKSHLRDLSDPQRICDADVDEVLDAYDALARQLEEVRQELRRYMDKYDDPGFMSEREQLERQLTELTKQNEILYEANIKYDNRLAEAQERLTEVSAALNRLTAKEPRYTLEGDNNVYCIYCEGEAPDGVERFPHDADCPWALAKVWP